MPVIPVIREAEVAESRCSVSLGNIARLHLTKKKKKKGRIAQILTFHELKHF